MAPEMLTKPTLTQLFHRVVDEGISEDELPCYDEKVDVWSLGVVVLYFLSGCNPFCPSPEHYGQKEALISTQIFETKQQQDMQQAWANEVMQTQPKVVEALARGAPALAEVWASSTGRQAVQANYIQARPAPACAGPSLPWLAPAPAPAAGAYLSSSHLGRWSRGARTARG